MAADMAALWRLAGAPTKEAAVAPRYMLDTEGVLVYQRFAVGGKGVL